MSTDESKTSAGGADDTDMSGNVNAFLREYPLWLFDLPPAGHVIVIPSDTSIADAVAILTKHNILAAPVRDVTCTHPNPAWHELYLGLFTMTDAVFAALKMEEIVSKARLPVVSETKEAPAASGPATQDLVTAMAAQSYFMVTPVRDMLSTFKFGPFIALTEGDDTSVLDAALILGRYGQHRVVVVQPTTGTGSEELSADVVREDRKLKNIITQSALVAVLAKDDVAKALRPFTSHSLAELDLVPPSKKVICADLDDDVLSACRLMVDNDLSAVGVVDGSGKLVACLSTRDVRVLVTSRRPLSILHGPVRSLIAMAASKTNDIKHASIVAKPSDSLDLVIRRMATSRIHRVFVVNDAQKPVGVVSLTDILNKMAHEPRKDYFRGFFDATVSA